MKVILYVKNESEIPQLGDEFILTETKGEYKNRDYQEVELDLKNLTHKNMDILEWETIPGDMKIKVRMIDEATKTIKKSVKEWQGVLNKIKKMKKGLVKK